MSAQSLSTKRAEVEFHNFASLGEPERAVRVYAEENARRGAVIRNHFNFIQWMSPFLEVGANVGHTSYMLTNEFGAEGYALDISADALRHGKVLMDRWELDRAPVRIAGDGEHLPFADNSLRMVLTFQTLSQFMDIDAIFQEIKRVLQPGGLFLFAEEPIRRMLSLRLYRAPYEEQMKTWEKKLHQWGLLGFLTQDVIGAAQEENFGIRQNHTMKLWDWDRLIRKHFVDHEYELFIADRGWGETLVRRIGRSIDKSGSEWVPARLLGGTLAAVCRKKGISTYPGDEAPFSTRFESLLRCPDCRSELHRNGEDTLQCLACGYAAPNEEGVFNLLPSASKKELYPGLRDDVIDFCQSDCASRLVDGFYEVEGVYGNKYRWMTGRGVFRLSRVDKASSTLRVRGHAHPAMLQQGQPARVELRANGRPLGTWTLDRPGLFVIETALEDAPEYTVEVIASPTFRMPPDERTFSVNLSLMRLTT